MTDTTAARRPPRTTPAHGLAQVRIRTLGTRPVGPLRVRTATHSPSRPAFPES